jgi:hypothetical protein
MLTGLPRALRFEEGNILNMDGIVNEHIQDEAHVWVMLKGHFSNNKFLNSITQMIMNQWVLI